MWIIVAALAAASLWLGSKTASLPALLGLAVLCSGAMAAVAATQTEDGAVYFRAQPPGASQCDLSRWAVRLRLCTLGGTPPDGDGSGNFAAWAP